MEISSRTTGVHEVSLNQGIDKVAQGMLDRGYSVIPIDRKSKAPKVRWGQLIGKPMVKWTYTGANVAILTGQESGIVVVDCDSTEGYRGWLASRPETPLMTRSPRGMHFYYRHPGQYVKSCSHLTAEEGFVYDVKGDRSYVLLPPSMKDGRQYQFCLHRDNLGMTWIDPQSLPVFDMAWRPDRLRRDGTPGQPQRKKTDVERYVMAIKAVEGNRNDTTYRVIQILKRENLSLGEIIRITIDWHARCCSPPWDISEIIRKVEDVYSQPC